jgi:outer membrane protein assembly factor BamE
MKPLLRLPLLALIVLAAGCLYRMPVQQGNMLDDNQVAQLETGMTRSQVLYLLGTPMVPPGFNNDRWDYYHYFNNYRGYRETRRLTVWFKDDKVDRIESDQPIDKEKAGNADAEPAAGPGS